MSVVLNILGPVLLVNHFVGRCKNCDLYVATPESDSVTELFFRISAGEIGALIVIILAVLRYISYSAYEPVANDRSLSPEWTRINVNNCF